VISKLTNYNVLLASLSPKKKSMD